jgi:hypothetical protein
MKVGISDAAHTFGTAFRALRVQRRPADTTRWDRIKGRCPPAEALRVVEPAEYVGEPQIEHGAQRLPPTGLLFAGKSRAFCPRAETAPGGPAEVAAGHFSQYT